MKKTIRTVPIAVGAVAALLLSSGPTFAAPNEADTNAVADVVADAAPDQDQLVEPQVSADHASVATGDSTARSLTKARTMELRQQCSSSMMAASVYKRSSQMPKQPHALPTLDQMA